MNKLILLRHGQSQWNLENRFTGWKDVSLTPNGIQEASFAGKQLVRANINIKSVYTSLLNRATETSEIVTEILNFPKDKIKYDWRLNERHYGALQGLNKSETAKKYGEDQVQIWRRSYDIQPPILDLNDQRHPRFNKKFKFINNKLPAGESLKNVIERLGPFWDEYNEYLRNSLGSHMIVAHSNSLRAIIKLIENISNKDIVEVNIPTGVPLIYEFDQNFNINHKKYLIDKNTLNSKLSEIKNQGKAKIKK